MDRYVVMLGAALLAAACSDKTRDGTAPPQASATNEVDAVTRAIAIGMAEPAARLAVRDAMRASPLTEHKLSFHQYGASAAAEPVLQAGAAATGTTLQELRARIAALPDLDFYLPSEQQRLSWRGGSDYFVTWSLGGESSHLAYDRDGATRAFDATKPQPPEAVFFLASAERKSPRIDRQPDVPGVTIQDPGDGQLSGSWVTIYRDGTTRTKYLADLVSPGRPMNVQCPPEGCDGGGGGGGGGTPQPPPSSPSPPTYLNQIITNHVYDNAGYGDESNEFDFRALKQDGTTEVLQVEGVPFSGIRILNQRLIQALPPMLVGGECINNSSCYIAARERDSWPDPDDLWYFHYQSAGGTSKCGSIPLGSNVAHYEAGEVVSRPPGASDEYRLFPLQEDENCDSDYTPGPNDDGWRLQVSFWWATSPVASVTVTPASATIGIGQTVALSATPRDAQGNVITGRTVTWTSSPTTVATVNSSSGVVNGVGGGQATITATIDGVSGTAGITVRSVATVTIAPNSATVCVNGSITLTATAKDQQGNVVTTGNVAWVSNNTNAATVTQTGSRTTTVSGVGSGQATITGTLSGISGTSTVTAGTCLPPPTNCQIQYLAGPKYLQVTWANADPAASTEVEINRNGAWTYAGTASPGATQYSYGLGSQTGLFSGRVRHVRSGYLPGGYCTTGTTTAP